MLFLQFLQVFSLLATRLVYILRLIAAGIYCCEHCVRATSLPDFLCYFDQNIPDGTYGLVERLVGATVGREEDLIVIVAESGVDFGNYHKATLIPRDCAAGASDSIA